MQSILKGLDRKFIVNGNAVVAICRFSYKGEIFKIRGVAKCSPEDIFDEKVGERVAYHKAKVLACNYVSSTLSTAYDFVSSILVNIYDDMVASRCEKDILKDKLNNSDLTKY